MTMQRVRPATLSPCATCGEPKELHIRGYVWPLSLAEAVQDGAVDARVQRNGMVVVGGQPFRQLPACRYKKARSPLRGTKRRIVTFAKEAERAVADAVGGRRIPVDGRTHGWDVETEHAGFEVKHRGLAWLSDAWDQALTARHGGKRPLVALVHKPGRGGHRQARIFIVEEVTEWRAYNG